MLGRFFFFFFFFLCIVVDRRELFDRQSSPLSGRTAHIYYVVVSRVSGFNSSGCSPPAYIQCTYVSTVNTEPSKGYQNYYDLALVCDMREQARKSQTNQERKSTGRGTQKLCWSSRLRCRMAGVASVTRTGGEAHADGDGRGWWLRSSGR